MASETMPYDGLKRCDWRVVQRQTLPFTQGGGGAVIEMGEPYWMIDCAYDNLSDAKFRAVTAFLGRRNGAIVPFRAYRADRQKPLNISNPQALIVSIAEQSAGIMRVTGTSKLLAGDMIAYKTITGARHIGEIIEVIASPADTTDFRLHPFASTPHAGGEVQIYRAEALFTIEPDSVAISEPYDKRRGVTFTARQLQRPFTEP